MAQKIEVSSPIHRETPYFSLRVYRWIISYVAPYWLMLVSLIFSGIVVVSIELAIPKFIQHFVNAVVPDRDVALFGWMLGGLSIALAAMFGFMALRNRLERMLREKASRDLQLDIFKQLRRLGFSYFERNAVGDSLYLFNTDVTKVQEIYRRYLPDIVWKGLFVGISMFLMIEIDYSMTFMMLISFCIYYILGPFLEKKTVAIINEGDKWNKQVEKQIYNSLTGLGEVRAFGSERWQFTEFMSNIKGRARNTVSFWFIWSSRESFRRFSYNLGAVGIFIYGAFLVRNNSLTVGEFIAFNMYYANGLLMLTNIITDITEQRALMVNAKRLYQFNHLEPEVADPIEPIHVNNVKGEVKFEQVSFGYPSHPQVIKGLNLHIQAGEKVALVGTTGSGKTTVLKLLGRFYDPLEGQIHLDGVPLNRIAFSQLREAMAYVFQETYLYGASVMENIRFGQPEASDQQVIQAAKAAYAHEFIMQLPQQYDTLLGERGVRLSGGQKQRIAIARMLIKNPSIILLDEATSALDQNSEWEVQKAFESLLKGKTTIAVAHRLTTVMNYDRILVLKEGIVVEEGKYTDLVARKGEFYRLLEGNMLHAEEE